MKILDLIQSFEPAFIEAAELATKLKNKAIKESKSQTGNSEVDIVTSADLEVQEFILKKLVASNLSKYELVAEENTPTSKLFTKKSEYIITIDPIDGTKSYAEGKKNYSFIAGVHNRKRPLYTFDYYPEYKWGIKIVNDDLTFLGQAPKIDTPKHPKTVTTFLESTAAQKAVPKLYKKLAKEGYRFVNKKSVTHKLGASGQFISNLVDGYYMKDGSAVDCLVGLHFSLANNFRVYKDIDISKVQKNSLGMDSYKGYYLALRN